MSQPQQPNLVETNEAAASRYDDPLLLANTQRQQVREILADRARSMTTKELATEIVAQTDGEAESVPGVAISLHHVHLPKLDDIGMVTYDPSRRRVDPR